MGKFSGKVFPVVSGQYDFHIYIYICVSWKALGCGIVHECFFYFFLIPFVNWCSWQSFQRQIYLYKGTTVLLKYWQEKKSYIWLEWYLWGNPLKSLVEIMHASVWTRVLAMYVLPWVVLTKRRGFSVSLQSTMYGCTDVSAKSAVLAHVGLAELFLHF